ncbi:hypothetical protein ACEXQB_007560 [Herbiconiux sp. P18]|uniref:hypothetical protein n=1 Tax=Herbiconiux liangxiaofengii TaxID=3342795 RepID=UPI0035BA3936
MTTSIPRSRTAFCSISAQPDNLGDIAIRQAVIDLIDASGTPLCIYTGGMPASYLQAFELPASARIITSQGRFLLAFLSACLRRRAHLVFAPGPFAARGGTNLLKSFASLANVIAARASGGVVVSLGRAIRGTNRADLAILRATIKAMNLFVARDSLTPSVVRLAVETAPDLALHDIAEGGARDRRYVVLSLRGDRPTNHALVAQVVEEAREAGLHPIFVTQVRRDETKHQELASQYGTEICSWTDESHSEQFTRIEAVYSQAHTVFSDRLHAIIFGLRYFALPIAFRHSDADKITPTLGHLIQLRVQQSDAAALNGPLVDDADSERARLESDVMSASQQLKELFGRVASLLGAAEFHNGRGRS